MAKLYSKTRILKGEDLIEPRTVFDATPSEAKQFDALGAARIATDAEVAAAKQAEAVANGIQ